MELSKIPPPPTGTKLSQLPHSARVLGLTMDRKGKLLLVNCHDRAIRMFEVLPASSLGGRTAQGGKDAKQVAQLLQDEAKVRTARHCSCHYKKLYYFPCLHTAALMP